MRINAMVRMTPDQQAKLNGIAESLLCVAGGGPMTGQPSWRVMLIGIADGVLVVRNPKDKAAKIKRKARRKEFREKKSSQLIPGAPEWWRPWYGNAMGIYYAMKASGLTRDALIAMGFQLKVLPHLIHPEIIIGKPEWPAPFVASRPHWWWRPIDDATMMVDDAVAASGMTVEQLVDGGLELSDCGQWLAPPDRWKGWSYRKAAVTDSDKT